jgi:SAM-dependent methyltransferase
MSAAAGSWLDSTALYDSMAPEYDAAFANQAHRRAYDRLAGEYIASLLPPTPGVIVDAGCGTGRWAEAWLKLGHRVIGIEQAPRMIEIIKQRRLGPAFSLLAEDMERVALAPGTADLVVAMGSLQYARDPAAMLRRFASWTKPGGFVYVNVDSLMALALELIRQGKREEALVRLETRRGIFTHGRHRAELHLYDSATLKAHFAAAGLIEVRCHGLLVTSTAWGSEGCAAAMNSDEAAFLELERALFASAPMADAGKHLVASGRNP